MEFDEKLSFDEPHVYRSRGSTSMSDVTFPLSYVVGIACVIGAACAGWYGLYSKVDKQGEEIAGFSARFTSIEGQLVELGATPPLPPRRKQ